MLLHTHRLWRKRQKLFHPSQSRAEAKEIKERVIGIVR